MSPRPRIKGRSRLFPAPTRQKHGDQPLRRTGWLAQETPFHGEVSFRLFVETVPPCRSPVLLPMPVRQAWMAFSTGTPRLRQGQPLR